MVIRIILIAVMVGLWGSFRPAGAADRSGTGTGAIDRFIEEGLMATGAPGAAFALIEDGKVTYVKGYGVTAAGGDPVTGSTVFNVASVTKTLVAIAVLQLEAESRLDLDAPAVTYLPDFATREAERSARITVRHLLSHRSGFSRVQGIAGRSFVTDETLADREGFYRRVGRMRLAAEPGSAFDYSNLNYDILGLVIEAVSGESYAAYIDARVLRPLGLERSRMNRPPEGARLASGHRFLFGSARSRPDDRPEAGAANGLYTTAEDLAALLVAVMNEDPRIVPAGALAAIADVERDPRLPYGLGWQFFDIDGHGLVYGHQGHAMGYMAEAAFSPSTRRGAVALTNASMGFAYGNTLATVSGAVRMGFDAEPQAAYDYPVERPVLGIIVGVVVFHLGWAAVLMRRMTRGATFALLPSLVLSGAQLAFAGAVLGVVPAQFGTDLAGAFAFQPDAGAALLTAAVAVAAPALLRLVELLRSRAE